MRYGIFSDIHSNLEAFDTVLDALSKEAIDSYLCIGDIVGYAANPRECIKRFQELSCISVIGNHDAAAAGILDSEYFNPTAKIAIFWTQQIISDKDKQFLGSLEYTYQNEDLILVHGTLNNPERFHYLLDASLAIKTFELMHRPVCFVGHSHIPAIFIQDNSKISAVNEFKIDISKDRKYIVNVGSVGQPRDSDSRAAYCIYDTDSHLIEIKRIEYNIKETQEKIIRAGLPKSLATRLARWS